MRYRGNGEIPDSHPPPAAVGPPLGRGRGRWRRTKRDRPSTGTGAPGGWAGRAGAAPAGGQPPSGDRTPGACGAQWDWEKAITEEDRTLDYLKDTVRRIWKVLTGAEKHVQKMFPKLKDKRFPNLPEQIRFIHAEDILDMYPDLPRKQRETLLVQKYPAVFIIGIGWVLGDGYPHEMRAADYDDWVTPTTSEDGRPMHGLNGAILVWNHLTKGRHELMSGGRRVNPEPRKPQLTITKQEHFLECPYHQAILRGEIPLSIGSGIGQGRTQMLLLRKAHIGEVTVTVWPKVLKELGARKDIHVLE